MKIRYYMKKRGKLPTHPIFVALYDGNQTELIFTGERIPVKEWNPREMEPRDQTGDLFAKIEKVKTQVQKTMKLLEAQDLPATPYTIKTEYNRALQQRNERQNTTDKKDKLGKVTVYSLAKAYKESPPDKYRKATLTTLKISIDQFMQYMDKHGLKSLGIKDLNNEIIEDYSKYLLSKRRLANSTHNKRMKHLNWFLKTIPFSAIIKPRKIRKRAIIALTVPELRALEAVKVKTIDLKAHKEVTHEFLQRAKDLFLLGCYSALRISDLKRINPANSSDGFISLTTQKNNEVFRIPIMPEAQEILSRYEGSAPKISEQEVNRSIKIVCQAAGIEKQIEIEYTQGGKDMIKTMPKYSLITSHISGKTFITNAKELWGLEPAEVAAIVRKDLKTMLNHYFKLPVESAISKMIAIRERSQMKIA